MLEAFKEHFDLNFPKLKQQKILLAVSGGIDSMTMLHLFKKLSLNIAVAHCNFKLRAAESDQDQAFVKAICKAEKLVFHTKNFHTKKNAQQQHTSTQMAARALRYEWFEALLENYNYDVLCTAHHADDNLETFFINLSRSSGIKGLTGIPAQRANLVRPLLAFTKNQIVDYARQQQIDYREDSSNQSTDYLRNAVRAKILPTIYEVFPNFQETSARSMQHLSAAATVLNDWIKSHAQHKVTQKDNCISISCEGFETKELRDAFVYHYLQFLGIKVDDVKTLKLLPEALSGKQLETENAIVQNDRGSLLIFFKEKLRKVPKLSLQAGVNSIRLNNGVLQINKVTSIDRPDINNLYVDEDKLSFPLEIRSRKSGDYIYPVGMQGKKTLKKLYIDLKIPKIQKEAVSILTSNDKIVWVIGRQADRRFLADKNSRNILKFTWNEA